MRRTATRARAVLIAVVFVVLVVINVAGAARADRAGWRWPIAGDPAVIRRFDPPAQPWLAGHRGVDLAGRPGAEVRAAGPGTVGYAGTAGGRGVVTILHAGGLRTTYLPVRPVVRPGQAVAAGQAVGVLESVAGHCRDTCLHWGLLRGDVYLDPLTLFGSGQVRLLPVWPSPRR
jgi:murein DD-endopeptidase MepM/ murein hydrolase activator NlpD